MHMSKGALFLLFSIILIEGYVVLSSELIAIRIMIPFVGSGTDTVSIIIAAVLLPLSFGYYAGGNFKPYRDFRGKLVGVREKLIRNVLISSVFLVFALSYFLQNILMTGLAGLGLTNRLVLTGIYSACFLITPVFLLGQTIPLISHYFSKEKLSKVTGHILFISTIGSFLGAIFSTLILMSTIGVHYTAAFNFVLMAALVILLSKRRSPGLARECILAVACVGIVLNTTHLLKALNVVENNRYNVVRVVENPETGMKTFSLNHNSDSGFDKDGNKYPYINYVESEFIKTYPADKPPMKILVFGAGGFTVGLEDTRNIYHFVDIDDTLKDAAEKHFLNNKLGPNKIFHPVAAESFVLRDTEKYDLIFMDVYQGKITIPENLVTQDFFASVKKLLADDGILATNFVVAPAFGDAFSRNLDATFRSVFPYFTRQIIGGQRAWQGNKFQNVVYVYYNQPPENERTEHIYTYNKNVSYYDRPKSID